MSDKQSFRLVHSAARKMACEAVNNAPDGYECQVKERTRNSDQNAKFHAMLGDVSKQLQYMGKPRTPAQWKVLFISGYAIATGLGAEVVPGIEGEFLNIRESSAQMGVKRMASLIEYVMAYGSSNGIRWSAPEDYL